MVHCSFSLDALPSSIFGCSFKSRNKSRSKPCKPDNAKELKIAMAAGTADPECLILVVFAFYSIKTDELKLDYFDEK